MRSVSVRLCDLENIRLNMGYVGENEHVHVLFDCKKAFDQYPNAVPSLVVVPPKGDSYPAVVTREGDIVEWVITDSDLIYHGNGKVQLQFQQGDVVMKSAEMRTFIAPSAVASGTIPTPIQNWIAQANAILAEIPEDINTALAAAQASGAFDGVGIVSITKTGSSGNVDTYTVLLTDENSYDFTVTNGTPGQNGVGIQNIAKTSTVGLVDTYTITLTNGDTYPFTVTNGQNGVEIDDTTPAVNKVFSSSKVDEELTDVKNAIDGKPDMKNTDAESGVFDITDGSGYVVLRLKNGHIETKGFDSAKAPAIKATDSDIGTFDLSDGNGNVILRLAGGHIQTKHFNSAVEPKPIEYKFSGSDLLLAYKYTATHDAVVVLNVGRANDLFDFSKFCLKDKGTSLENLETADLTTIWSSGTDMHSPFQFNVTTDADGYYASSADPSFTGGNHKVEINGSNIKSASSKYVYFFADGEPVTTGYGLCNHFTMKWANEVQAYNCVKADGTGRTSLIEYHEMIFDGVRFNEEIMLVPKEEITMKLWYGLQSVSWQVTYTKARFIDGTNRNEFDAEDNSITSGNAKTSGVIETGANHSMEMTVDICTDLGARPYYTGTSGAFIVSYGTSGKGYFNIINQSVTMDEGDGYFLRGSYRFYPTVA